MIAIIAGTGTLPLEACRILTRRGEPFFVLALFGQENGSALREHCNLVIDQTAYKAAEILATLQRHGATRVLFVGKVDKQLLLKKINLDWLAIKLLGSLLYKNDHAIMESILAEVTQRGMAVMHQHDIFDGLLVKPGIITGTVEEQLQQSIDLGMRTAALVARADIGQTVVVKDAMILAIEAIEGTDACIKRAIALAGSGTVICKSAFAAHNTKYDLPTIGPATLEALQPSQVQAIAWQSSHTLVVDLPRCIELACERGITLVSV